MKPRTIKKEKRIIKSISMHFQTLDKWHSGEPKRMQNSKTKTKDAVGRIQVALGGKNQPQNWGCASYGTNRGAGEFLSGLIIEFWHSEYLLTS